MKISEAIKNVQDFYDISCPSEDEVFIYTESLAYLIEETRQPGYMMELGGYYYEIKNFELALKYYEMAADYDYEPAYACLGYVWYYGRTGSKDYEKAFNYFSKSADAGNKVSKYKLADMYRNGYFVKADYEKYKSIIEDLYMNMSKITNLNEPVPEIYTRMAKIRSTEADSVQDVSLKEDLIDEAVNMYLNAKRFLALRIHYNAFFGNLSIMKYLIDDLYELREFDEKDFDFYDLYYLFQTPHKISFIYKKHKYMLESTLEDDGIAINFDGNWFRSIDDFFAKAQIGKKKLTAIEDEFGIFKIEN